MTRNISGVALSSLLAEETSEAYLLLLTLTIPGQPTPLRWTSDAVDTDQGGTIYSPFPFDLILPVDEENQVSEARLTITNVDRSLVDAVRNLTAPIAVEIMVVLSSDPSDIMARFSDFTLKQIEMNVNTITGVLTLEDFLAEPLSRIMSAADYPGLF